MNLQMKDPVTGAVPELRQWYFFREALIEKYGEVDEYQIAVDHEQGDCYYDGVKYPLIFPQRICEFIPLDVLTKNRFFSHHFIGKRTEDRVWVKQFVHQYGCVFFSDKGRELAKDEIDLEYLLSMCDSTFALCPKGDHLWTYRFFEACICGSVPVVRLGEVAEAYEPYYYLPYDGDMSKFYRQLKPEIIADMRMHNHEMFLTRNLLPL
jgi:hypothetical protein